MRTPLILVTTVVISTCAADGPPAVGTNTSDDFGGVMLTGRFSESWPDRPTINAMD